MKAFFNGIRETVAPRPGERHGPLPPLLLGLTAVTGLVDAFSYLVLGHVFVANMTGNVLFLGFALAGAPGFSIGASARCARAPSGSVRSPGERWGSGWGRTGATSSPPPCPARPLSSPSACCSPP